MTKATLNRRVAELGGWRVRLCSQDHFPYWRLLDPAGNTVDTCDCGSVDDAWDLLSGVLPDYSGDPSAALALLEKSGTHWSCSTLFSGGYEVEVYGVEGEDALHCAEAATFAEAAARAWVQWKEAGDE